MENRLLSTSSPHITSKETVSTLMYDVIIALVPAIIASVYFFGMSALKLNLVAVVTAVLTEFVIQKLTKKKITIRDGSAAITGLLLAFNIPPAAPWWIAVIGAMFAVGIAKQAFGGLGQNFINPALAGRAMLLASWPVIMTTWTAPGPDAITTATPLALLKGNTALVEGLPAIKDMFIGNIGGTLGETSAIALLLGGAYLLIRKVITWEIPTFYIGTVAAIMLVAGSGDINYMLYHLLSGGLLLGAFFMATDYVTAPITPKGKIIFAVGAGLLTAVIRLKGGYPEGVSYSILIMNLVAPLIEKYTSPKIFGEAK